jgi:hypothetical protein
MEELALWENPKEISSFLQPNSSRLNKVKRFNVLMKEQAFCRYKTSYS